MHEGAEDKRRLHVLAGPAIAKLRWSRVSRLDLTLSEAARNEWVVPSLPPLISMLVLIS